MIFFRLLAATGPAHTAYVQPQKGVALTDPDVMDKGILMMGWAIFEHSTGWILR